MKPEAVKLCTIQKELFGTIEQTPSIYILMKLIHLENFIGENDADSISALHHSLDFVYIAVIDLIAHFDAPTVKLNVLQSVHIGDPIVIAKEGINRVMPHW